MPSFERGAYEPSDDVRVFDGAVDDDQDEEGSRLPLLIVIGLLVFAMFAGVVWLAYSQGVAKGRSDAPRVIVADTGPVKIAPSNPGGTQTPYTGLKIYQSPAPADDPNDEESSTPAPTLAGPSAKTATPPATSPSLAPVIRPSAAPAGTKTATGPAPTPAAASGTATAPQAPPLANGPTADQILSRVQQNLADERVAENASTVATKPPAKLSPLATTPAPKPIVAKTPATQKPASPQAAVRICCKSALTNPKRKQRPRGIPTRRSIPWWAVMSPISRKSIWATRAPGIGCASDLSATRRLRPRFATS
jgi:hypothetical protein